MKLENDYAAFPRAITERVIQRLAWMTLQPRLIVSLSDDSFYTDLLNIRYPNASIVTGTLDSLVLEKNSVDLIISPWYFPWCDSFSMALQRCQSWLRPEGVIALTYFGPETVALMSKNHEAFPHRMDMHHVGDLLMKVGFLDPVLDVEHFTVRYRDYTKMMSELQYIGLLTAEEDAIAIPSNEDGAFDIPYEIIYAHAFGSDPHTVSEAGQTITRIPIDRIQRR